ncbi:MAG: TIGR04076 family protein [Spirochaetota bacterium]|nr:MAG: TIGR04076 family protein [Spirochaetota bacterium]
MNGICPLYKPGQVLSELHWWYFDEQKTTNLCSHALCSMMTALNPFSRGVSAKEMGNRKEDDIAFVQCPDP